MTEEKKHIIIVHKELEMTEEEIAGKLKEFEKLTFPEKAFYFLFLLIILIPAAILHISSLNPV